MKYLITYEDSAPGDAMGKTKTVYKTLDAGTRQEARYKLMSLVHRIIIIREVKALLERKAPKRKQLTRKQ